MLFTFSQCLVPTRQNNIIGHGMFGLLFCLTVCWVSPTVVLSRQHECGKPQSARCYKVLSELALEAIKNSSFTLLRHTPDLAQSDLFVS